MDYDGSGAISQQEFGEGCLRAKENASSKHLRSAHHTLQKAWASLEEQNLHLQTKMKDVRTELAAQMDRKPKLMEASLLRAVLAQKQLFVKS